MPEINAIQLHLGKLENRIKTLYAEMYVVSLDGHMAFVILLIK
jgi:hypothetical protein